MATNPVTYRISPEVDAELKVLADQHGGVDKALRVLLEARRNLYEEFGRTDLITPPSDDRPSGKFKSPLLKPKDRR